MGGGGNLVDGVRRWLFHRPSSSSSNNKHKTIVLKSDTFSNPDQSGDSNELILVTEDLDFSGLQLIKVPKRNHLPIDPQKKVPFFFSSFFVDGWLFCWECRDDLI